MKRREFFKLASTFIAAVSFPAGLIKPLSGSIAKLPRRIKIPLKKFRISDIYKKHDLGG